MNLAEQIIEIKNESIIDFAWSVSNEHKPVKKSINEQNFLYVLTDKSIKIYSVLSDFLDPFSNAENNFSVILLDSVEFQNS